MLATLLTLSGVSGVGVDGVIAHSEFVPQLLDHLRVAELEHGERHAPRYCSAALH